jgi:hypothetical protein
MEDGYEIGINLGTALAVTIRRSACKGAQSFESWSGWPDLNRRHTHIHGRKAVPGWPASAGMAAATTSSCTKLLELPDGKLWKRALSRKNGVSK